MSRWLNIRGKALIGAVVTTAYAILAAEPVAAETLEDALSAAYTSNPTLAAERAALRATDEAVPQAISGWRPNVSLGVNYGQTRIESETPTSLFGFGNQVFENNRTVNPFGVQGRVQQPIFRGGRTLYGTRQAEAQILAGREQLRQTEQSVLLAAVSAYMDVLRDEAVLDLNQNQVEVLKRQLEASQDRFRVGEITRTDVAQSEARLSFAVSNVASAQAQLTASRAAYERVVGRAPGTLEEPPPLPPLPSSELDARNIALDINPTLLASRYAEEASRQAIKVARGSLLPSADVLLDYQHGEDQSAVGDMSTRYSVTGQLNVPLYQSGSAYSRLRQARQVNSQNRIQIVEARRAVVEQVANSWESLRSAKSSIRAGREQVRANEIALEGVRQEAAVGSRTTLDVLDAEQELLLSRVSLVRSERNEYVAAYQLLASTGQLTAQQLGLSVPIYDPTDHYDKVRFQSFGGRPGSILERAFGAADE